MTIKKEHLKQMLDNIEKMPEDQQFQSLQMAMVISNYQQNINFGINKQPLSIGESLSELNLLIDKHIKENTKPCPDFDRTGMPDCIKVSSLYGQPIFSQ